MESLLTFDKNTMPMIYDIIRIVTIQVITQFLFVINNNGTDVKFFNSTFLILII